MVNAGYDERYFVAVPLPDEHKSVLAEWCRSTKEAYPFRKWVFEQDYHITLKYLGACSLLKTEQVKESLIRLVSGESCFALSIGYPGVFGREGAPRILWAGVEGQLAALEKLQSHVDNAMAKEGFPKENRPYRPHITLAKQYKGTRFNLDAFASNRMSGGGTDCWQVNSIVLYRTVLGSKPMYVPEGVYEFKAM